MILFSCNINIVFVHYIDIFVHFTYIIFICTKGGEYMASTNISIRMDAKLKEQADIFFNELGMNISTAFNIFVRQSLREGRIPFDISINQPKAETIAALSEAEAIAIDPNTKRYNDVEEALKELKK